MIIVVGGDGSRDDTVLQEKDLLSIRIPYMKENRMVRIFFTEVSVFYFISIDKKILIIIRRNVKSLK